MYNNYEFVDHENLKMEPLLKGNGGSCEKRNNCSLEIIYLPIY